MKYKEIKEYCDLKKAGREKLMYCLMYLYTLAWYKFRSRRFIKKEIRLLIKFYNN